MAFVARRWRLSLSVLVLAAAAALVVWSGRTAAVADACAFATLPETYESLTYRSDYPYVMDLAAYNLLFPGDNEFSRQPLEQGPRTARVVGGGHIPPVLLRSIGFVESRWQMGSSAIPYGGTGSALASVIGDCGYGVMQVTSGMTVPLGSSGGASPVQALIATHFAYNIARGTAILANKWNDGVDIRPIVGSSDPNILESWYFAVWGYNGFALVNHPFAERYTNPIRLPFSCNPNDGFGHDRSQYPYQELVYGCVMNPPIRDGTPLWPGQPVGLPNLFDDKVKQALDLKNFVYPYDKMDLPQPQVGTPDKSTQPSPDRRAALVGAPTLQVDPSEISVTLTAGSTSADAQVITLQNTGTGVGPWIAVASAPWVKSVPPAGVAIGPDVRCRTETSFCDRSPQAQLRLDLGALKPGTNTATLTYFSPQQPDNAHTVTVRVTVTKPGQARPVVKTLAAGCNGVGSAFPKGTSIADVVATIEPSSAIAAIWRLPAGGSWELYVPGQAGVSTLKAVNPQEGLFVCLKAAATMTQSVAAAPAPEATALSPGCGFVAVAEDGGVGSFLAKLQPASALVSVWRFDTPGNRWQMFLPASPFTATLTDLRQLDAVFLCTSAAATLTQPGLAPDSGAQAP